MHDAMGEAGRCLPAVAMRAMGWSSAQQLLHYTNLRNQDVVMLLERRRGVCPSFYPTANRQQKKRASD
jgi:hypothetical protein